MNEKDKKWNNSRLRSIPADQLEYLLDCENKILLKDKVIELMAEHEFKLVGVVPSMSFTSNIKCPKDLIESYERQVSIDLESKKEEIMELTVEQKMFSKYDVVESKPCKFNLGCGHAVPCNKCERPPVLPSVSFTKIYMLEEIITRHYNILILDRYSGFIRLTACPTPDENLGCDEAYYRIVVEQPSKSDAICELITKIYHDLTNEERIEVKNILEAA